MKLLMKMSALLLVGNFLYGMVAGEEHYLQRCDIQVLDCKSLEARLGDDYDPNEGIGTPEGTILHQLAYVSSPFAKEKGYPHVVPSLKEKVTWLVNKGADVNALDSDGCAPLECTRNIEMTRALIEHGAQVTPQLRKLIADLRWEAGCSNVESDDDSWLGRRTITSHKSINEKKADLDWIDAIGKLFAAKGIEITPARH